MSRIFTRGQIYLDVRFSSQQTVAAHGWFTWNFSNYSFIKEFMRYTSCASSDLNQQGNPPERAHFLVALPTRMKTFFLLLNNLWGENKRTKSFSAAFTSSKGMKIKAKSLLGIIFFAAKYTREGKKLLLKGKIPLG